MELTTEQIIAIAVVGFFFIALVVYLYSLSLKSDNKSSIFSFSFFSKNTEVKDENSDTPENPGS
tara:strand:+ start:181 stop:372 length:192 start_codon:yes stop_codon:yes gene_type:complete